MKKLNLFDKFLFLINSIIAILLLTTYILPYINPEKYPSLAILSLAYPVLLVSNIVFAILWMVKLKRQFLLSTICILLGISQLNAFYSIKNKTVLKQNDIKLLSFNVRHFNSLNWIKSPTVKQDICDFVNSKNVDIICFQECTNTKNINIKLDKAIEKTHYSSAQAIYSKYPVINSGSLDFKYTSNNIIFADLKINNEIIRVYNVHLQSFQLNINKENFGVYNKDALVKKFKTVFKQQAYQIKTLKEHVKNCPYRTIVAGDFNNTAFSWNYHQVIENRKDAFVEAGNGFGKSYNYFFPFRIDFILPDNTMDVGQFITYDVNLSDHFPVMARINLNN